MISKLTKKWTCFNTDTGLLVLRIGMSIIFILAGWEKVSNLSLTVAAFSDMGIGIFWAYIVSFVELLGGIAVLLGVYTRIAALLLSIVMIVAISIVYKNVSMVMLPVSVLFSTSTLFLSGSGKYSLMKKMCGCGVCIHCEESN